jgi:hypothetical protein
MILLFAVEGCSYEGTYPFRQDSSNIEKVEIYEIDYEIDNKKLIVQLAESEGQKLVAELATMKCEKYGPGDHPRNYGLMMICITYTDTEIEMIGLSNIGFVDAEGRKGLTHYFFDAKSLYDLIVKYVDPALLPDVSKEYPSWYWDSTTNASDPT